MKIDNLYRARGKGFPKKAPPSSRQIGMKSSKISKGQRVKKDPITQSKRKTCETLGQNKNYQLLKQMPLIII
jgi:hypothetical protein